MNKANIFSLIFVGIAVAAILSSCQDKRSRGLEYAPNMYYPIAFNPDQKNKNFADGKTAQLPPNNTTPVGFTRYDQFADTPEGYLEASNNMVNPLVVNKKNLLEGQQLYIAMCAPCHGEKGAGNGKIVELGKYPAPPAYASGMSSRGGAMKDLTDGKIYHTMQYGLNLMGSYASQLSPEERWKVVMYVHELQKGQ
ncbi:c-type cytochrome [Pedobacter cryophilus]|uniref:Cytochrome c n=1 Tax=Pedobacter cryophilus TaxID=2571271 RepID=A0A4U1C9F1_9SPHI|nr:cytochrome c [Pedobacter cryophilus]TKC00268.1 cytochrome c [Pedobacter cryophilus]